MSNTYIKKLYKLFLKYRSVSIDTRSLKNGDLFFALKGPNFDGNKYAAQALESGASRVIVDDKNIEGVHSGDERYLLVDDTLKTLQMLSRFHREQSKAQVIGITGSNGKTTTKELVAEVLATQYDIIYTQGNLNNHIGLPLTLLRIEDETEIAIVEMGANHIGEIAELSSIAKPDFGLITNIGKAHIEGFGSLEGVKIGKGELYSYIKNTEGRLFVNSFDSTLVDLAGNYPRSTLYSSDNSFQNTIVDFSEVDGSLEVAFDWKNEEHRKRTQLYGEYNIPNILAAMNIGFYFKVSPLRALEVLANYVPQNSRSQRLKTEANEIYLDAYNANPSSMELALNAFSKVKAANKLVVLGDMFELGETSVELHQIIVNQADKLFDQAVFIGELFNKTTTDSMQFRSTASFNEYLSDKPIRGKTILLKGSRGMALEKLLDRL